MIHTASLVLEDGKFAGYSLPRSRNDGAGETSREQVARLGVHRQPPRVVHTSVSGTARCYHEPDLR
jgi:hypothetical protein